MSATERIWAAGWSGYVLAAAIVIACGAALALVTPLTPENGGLGYDGALYAQMVQDLRGAARVPVTSLQAYRIAPSALVAASPLDVITGFRIIDAAAVLAAGVLLFAILRRYDTPRWLALLAVLWWALLPMQLQFWIRDPVLVEAPAFALLLGLVLAALHGRFAVFAALLPVAVLTRENLLIAVPFLFLQNRGLGARRALILTALASVPGVIALQAVRAYPPVPTYPIVRLPEAAVLGLFSVLLNLDDDAWRYLAAIVGTFGVLWALPFATSRAAGDFVRREAGWAYLIVAALIVAILGGREHDRYLVPLTVPLVVLTFAVGHRCGVWRSWRRAAALTGLQLVALRLLAPLGSPDAPFGTTALSIGDLVIVALFGVVAGAAAIAVASGANPLAAQRGPARRAEPAR
jgi:hypothetical protein